MKNGSFITTAACWTLVAMACTDGQENIPASDEVTQITISANDFKQETSARTTLEISSSGAVFSWAATDTVGIFPNSGAQVYFPMASGAGTKTARFTGGGWALKNSYTYAAYYPFIGNYYLDKTNLPLDYEGQVQTGNASTEHLGAFDYMAATPAAPSSGYVNFQFDHLGCLVRLRLTTPVAASFTSLALKCEQPIFTSTAALSLQRRSYSVTNVESTQRMELGLTDIRATRTGQELTFFLMLAPTDLTGHTVHVQLLAANGKCYQGTLESKNLLAGYTYDFAATLEELMLTASSLDAPGFGQKENNV